MKNRWSAEARAASAAARLEKYGPMMGLQPWGDTARAAAAASRAARAAQAGGMTASEATEFALDARFGTGYLSDGSGGIDVTLGLGRERSSGSYSGGRRIPVMSDATPFEDRKAKYETAFREWWKGVQATEQNIAAFHAFVAAFGGAAAGSMGAYRQATGEQPVAGMSRLIGKGRGYLSGETPMYDESGVLAGWAKTGAARYGRTFRPVGRQPRSKAANLRFDLGRAKIVDPKTGRTVGRAAYSSDGDWPVPSRDMRGVQKAYDMGVRAFGDGTSLEQALRETGIVAGSEEAYMFQKGWQDAPAVTEAVESFEPYSLELPEYASASVLDDYGPLKVYDYGVSAYRDGLSLEEALHEAGVQPGTEAAFSVEKGYNDAVALLDPEEEDEGGAAVAEESLGEEYERYLDEVNAARDAEMAAKGLDPLGYPLNPGASREAALAGSYGRSEDAYNELALMREPLYDKARFGGRMDQYRRAMAVQRNIFELGPREGDSEDQAEGRGMLSAAFDAIARGRDASSYIEAAEEVAADLEAVPPREAPAPSAIRETDLRPHVMDLPGGGNFDEASESLPEDAFGDITPEQRSAARALGVLEGQWGVNGMVERMVPPQLLDEYEAGLAEGRKDPVKTATAPSDRAAVIRAARAYLDGKLGGTDDDTAGAPDHINDRWNVAMYEDGDDWASRNKEGIEKGLPDTRRQYSDASLVKAGLEWLGNAVVDGDHEAADAAVAYLADLLSGVKEVKMSPGRVASDEDGDGDAAEDVVEFDEEGDEIEGERFFEDSYADPDMPMPWEFGGSSSFRKWFPGVKNRSAVANRLVAIDKYREQGLRNAWSDAARVASAAARLAEYGPMMGLKPWGDAARASAAAARGAKRGGNAGGEGYTSSDGSSGVTLASSSGGKGGSKSSSGRGGGGRRKPPASSGRGAVADPVKAKAKFEAHGFGSLNEEQRKALFDDIKKRAEAGENLTEADRSFLAGFESFLDKELKESSAKDTDNPYEAARAAYRLKHGRDPKNAKEWEEAKKMTGLPESSFGAKVGEVRYGFGPDDDAGGAENLSAAFEEKYGRAPETDGEWSEAEELAGVPEEMRGFGAPEPAGAEGLAGAFKKKYGREPDTDADWAEAEELAGVPENKRGHGDPVPADKAVADGKTLRQSGLEQFRKATGREPRTGEDFDRVDMLGGVPKEQWWDVALHDGNAPDDAGIGRARAKEIAAAGDAAKNAKAAMRKAGVPGGDPPAHWSEAAKRRFRERQKDALKQAGKEERAAKLREERALRRETLRKSSAADWASKAFTGIRPKRVKDSGEERAIRLAGERRQRRSAREKLFTADWLEGGMPASKGGVRDGLPASWDSRVLPSSAVGFSVPRDPGVIYSGRGKGPFYGLPQSADGAVFYQGRWIDKKTGRTVKPGVKV